LTIAVIYITEQGAEITKRGDRIRIFKQDELLLDMPCHQIDAVLVFGNVQITTQALAELLDHDIELALLSSRGRLRGQLTSPSTKNIELRIAQYKCCCDESFVLALSRSIVAGKLINERTLLQRYMDDHPEIDIKLEIELLRRNLQAVEEAQSTASLLGFEGSAASAYFDAFKKMIRADFDFPGRRRRPPTDPVNALLSFGYTLLFNEIGSLLDGLGFDPYLGIFHKPDYGRPSLAADLLEEFRSPVVDRFTLNLLNNRMFRREDFQLHVPSGGLHLTPEAMKRYFASYEEYLSQKFRDAECGEETSFRRSYRRQAEKLGQCMKDAEPYRAFAWTR
jgi:CRISP-associated protein Cas1